MNQCEPYFPPPGDHIRDYFRSGSNADMGKALKEIHQMGWRKDRTRSEPTPPIAIRTGKKEYHPWWISPEGHYVRGMVTAMKTALLALEPPSIPEPKPEPSPMAQRILKALEQHPDLREELRLLLR